MYIITIYCPSGLIQDSEELKRRSILLVFFMCLVKRYYVLSVRLSLTTSFLSSTSIFASRNSWLRVPFSFKSLCLNAWNLNLILKESFYFQNKVTVKEVKFKKEYLNDEDVFLIDLGLQIFQVHFSCQTKRLFTWENSHRHEFHIEMTFYFVSRLHYDWVTSYLKIWRLHFMLIKYTCDSKSQTLRMATCSSLLADRFHNIMGSCFAFTWYCCKISYWSEILTPAWHFVVVSCWQI